MKITKDRIKEIIREEMIREFKEIPGKSKSMSLVNSKADALKQLKERGITFTEEEKEVHGFTWYNKNKTVAEMDKHMLIIYEGVEKKQQRLDEALTSSDYKDIKDIIRAEIAAVFFDLFKKRQTWI